MSYMKSIILLTAYLLLLSGCITYPQTTFWVQNDTDKTVQFNATVYKIHLEEMTLPFSVAPNSKVLVRQIGLTEKGNVRNVFSKISFITPDSIKVKDPMDPLNWVKTTDAAGKPTYFFHVDKK